MRSIRISLGRALFWLSWPALWVMLKLGRRTRGIIEHDGQILVLKGWLSSGKWQLPGGGIHWGEEPAAGLIREIKEETGVTIKSEHIKYLGNGTAVNHGLSFKYEAFIISLGFKPRLFPRRSEVVEARWLTPDELNENNASSDLLQIIDRWL